MDPGYNLHLKPGALCRVNKTVFWANVFDSNGDTINTTKSGTTVMFIKNSMMDGYLVCLVNGGLGEIADIYLDEVK